MRKEDFLFCRNIFLSVSPERGYFFVKTCISSVFSKRLAAVYLPSANQRRKVRANRVRGKAGLTCGFGRVRFANRRPGPCWQGQAKGGEADDGGRRLSRGAFAAVLPEGTSPQGCEGFVLHGGTRWKRSLGGRGYGKGKYYYPNSQAFSPRDKGVSKISRSCAPKVTPKADGRVCDALFRPFSSSPSALRPSYFRNSLGAGKTHPFIHQPQ